MAVDAVNFNCDESTSLLCKTLKDNRLGKQGVRARQGKCGGADDWWELEWPEGTGEELERTGKTGMVGEEPEGIGKTGMAGDNWEELQWPEGTGEELEWLERAGEEPEGTGKTGMAGDGWEELEWPEGTGEEPERAGRTGNPGTMKKEPLRAGRLLGYLLQQLSETEGKLEAGHCQDLDVVVDGPVRGHARGMKFHDSALIHAGCYLDSEHQTRRHRVVNTSDYTSLDCPGLTCLIRGGGQFDGVLLLVIHSGVREVCLQTGELESEHHSDIRRDAGIVRQEVEVSTDLSVELVAGTSHYILRVRDRHVGYREIALDEVLLGCRTDIHTEHHVDIEAFVDEEGITDTYRIDYTVAIHTA